MVALGMRSTKALQLLGNFVSSPHPLPEFTPEPCFVLTIPDFGPLDAKTWPRDAPDHTYCI